MEFLPLKYLFVYTLIKLQRPGGAKAKIDAYLANYRTKPKKAPLIAEAISLLKIKISMLSEKFEENTVQEGREEEWEKQVAVDFIRIFLDMVKISPKGVY